MDDFIPPVDDPAIVALAKMLLPLAKFQNGLTIRVSENCKNIVASLNRKHSVLMINHSDRFDPLCACALSSECGENFNFLASREQFDRQFGFAGWVLQHLGTYSVIRGRKVERASAKETVKILVQGKHKLAQFPEGDVTGRDDAVLPLKEDGLINLFEAQRQLLKLTGESLHVLPVAMYYEVRHDSIKQMTDCINRLENAFHISSLNTIELSFEQKIKRLVSHYIAHLSNLYGVVLMHKQSLSAELKELSRKITLMAARGNGISFDAEEDDAVLLYGVRAELRKAAEPCAISHCRYKHKLQDMSKSKHEIFVHDLDLAEQLLILASTLESTKFTPEIAWRVLDRLELEVIGKTTPKGHRTAWVDAAPPIDLAPIFNRFELDNQDGLAEIDKQVRSAILEMMQKMQNKCKTVVSV
ncbi:MAG: 1-acyl-sn-glycerol-3-phosphate acyltransferase [Cyanobacteria bacterium SZAS-4]|nr:1-acyl-sn-glycerol-3-phosphate acyltransferase [Cyanobacteria bacterium SZAS-4]